MKAQNRSGFSMIELVFVIVILGVLAAVAVPRFVATRTDAQVATTRSDLASVQKAIVAKVFADNIDTTSEKSYDPNMPWTQGAELTGGWAEWIMLVGGLDGSRWKMGGDGQKVLDKMAASVGGGAWTLTKNAIEPVGNKKDSDKQGGGVGKGGCGAVLGIFNGYMIFAPNNIGQTDPNASKTRGDFCDQLKNSYASSGGPGNKIVPLASSGTVEF